MRKKVGEGQFSEVYEVEDAIDGKLVSVGGVISADQPNASALPAAAATCCRHEEPLAEAGTQTRPAWLRLQYALKIERTPDVKTIRQEHKTLRKLQGCSQICRARGSGTHGGRFYMVLDLLGQNLVEVRRGAYGGRMDLPTAKVRCSSAGGFRTPQGPHSLGLWHGVGAAAG